MTMAEMILEIGWSYCHRTHDILFIRAQREALKTAKAKKPTFTTVSTDAGEKE